MPPAEDALVHTGQAGDGLHAPVTPYPVKGVLVAVNIDLVHLHSFTQLWVPMTLYPCLVKLFRNIGVTISLGSPVAGFSLVLPFLITFQMSSRSILSSSTSE